MVLIDSLYINNSGGKVLLDYLVEEIENAQLNVFYLFDERCKDDFQNIPRNRKVYLKASMKRRNRFYLKNKNRFSKVFCFANIPPPIKLKDKEVFTYFHNTLLVDVPKYYPLKVKMKVFLQKQILLLYKKNTDYWIVQSKFVKNKLNQRIIKRKHAIKIIPFFRLEDKSKFTKEKDLNSFCYVSTGATHKNHQRLLNAWYILLKRNIVPELRLTVPQDSVELINRIKEINDNGGKIINYGLVEKSKVQEIYSQTEYLIYPSLTESFGLPLIEAANAGCKILGADLEYINEAVYTELKFDPYNSEDIADKVEFCCKENTNNPSIRIKNEINLIIELLK